MSEWQKIETAPKDGTTILGFVPAGVVVHYLLAWPEDHSFDIFPVRWTAPREHTYRDSAWFAAAVDTSFGPYDDPSTDFDPVECEPTHWMPLPKPPVDTK